MNYAVWNLLGIAVGVVIVTLYFEVIWRRETGKKWWFLKK